MHIFLYLLPNDSTFLFNPCIRILLLEVTTVVTTVAICGKDEYMCADETCIPVEYRCDGTFADCNGAEDELSCGWYKYKICVK